MKRRTQIIVAAAVLVGLVVFSAARRGGRGDAGKCSGGGACCPLMSGMNLWPTNPWTGLGTANTNAGTTASGSVTNRQR